jgi:hypothetical protein
MFYLCQRYSQAMSKLICLAIIATFGLTTVNAQDKTEKQTKYDTAYIKDLSDRLSIRVYGVNKFSNFGIKDNDSALSVAYAPNSNLNFGIGFNYKWFGLGIAFNLPFINNDNDRYGETKRLDFQTNVFTRSLAIDFYVQSFQGFYVENPQDYIPGWDPESPYPQRPDILSTTLGGSCIYAFRHKKYSAKAAFIQTDLQRKSAGSFLLGGFFSLFRVEGDSAFIPNEIIDQCNPDLTFNNLRVSGIGVAGGYSHTFVMWKRLYLSVTLVPGLAIQSYNISYPANFDEKRGSFFAGRFAARAALVYNTERLYAGVTAINDSFSGNTGKEQQNSLSYQLGVIRFFYGMRFIVNKKKG